MKHTHVYSIYPRDALFVPSAGKTAAALRALDRELGCDLESGAPFQGFAATVVESGEGERADMSDYSDFQQALERLRGDLQELHVRLPQVARDPLESEGLRTEGVELRIHPRLRMVDFAALPVRAICPACGAKQDLALTGPGRPEPRLYCSDCGSLTPIEQTEVEIPAVGPTETRILPAPCYRFAVSFRARPASGEGDPVAAWFLPAKLDSSLARALGCGLSGLLIGGLESW